MVVKKRISLVKSPSKGVIPVKTGILTHKLGMTIPHNHKVSYLPRLLILSGVEVPTVYSDNVLDFGGELPKASGS